MRQTKKCEIIEVAVTTISIQMSYLALFLLHVSIEPKANTAATAAKEEDLVFDLLRNRLARHSTRVSHITKVDFHET